MPRFNNDGHTSKFLHMNNGGGGGGGGGRRFDHDDRNKFKFMVGGRRGGIGKKNRQGAFTRLDATGDTIMEGGPDGAGGSGDSRGHRGRGRGRVHFDSSAGGGRGGGRNRTWRKQGDREHQHQRHSFGGNWHKIVIDNGQAYDKEYVLSSLRNACRLSFIPVLWLRFGVNTAFYVDKREVAEALAELDRKITSPDGNTQIGLRVSSSGAPPTAHIDDACDTRIKAVVGKRYNTALNTLNLENFHMDPDLVNDYYLPLTRPSVPSYLFKLLEPLHSSILGIDFSNNNITSLEVVNKMVNKSLTNLKALCFRGNKIQELSSLDRISAPGLIELILEGNPILDKYDDREAFISSLRKRFPKLIKLDGVDLPPTFSMPDVLDTKLPEIRGSSFCNLQAKEVVNKFWSLYVSIFDSEDRRPLMDAYHDASTMSMMAAYMQQGQVSNVDSSKKLSYYIGESRNLLRQTDRNKRFKLLHQGKLDIVAFLTKLPKTTHDPNSYLIDMPVAVENFILFTVTGLYKERDERSLPHRFFSRTFTLVPQNAGFVIINEMLYVTNPTHQQLKNAFRPPPPTPSPSPIPHVQVVPLPVAVPTDQERHSMLIAFMQQSGMNEEWSRNCLEQNAWDFSKSAVIFTQLKEQNKIPPEAFVKQQ